MRTSSVHLPCQKEMRRLRRQPFSSIIAVMHPNGGASAAFARDVNADGIYFTCNSEVTNESAVDLLIPIASQVLRCKGRVVRTESNPRTNGFGTVVVFDCTDVEHQAA